MYKSICGVAILALMAGCTSIHKSANSSPVDVETQATIKASIDVGADIEGSASAMLILGFIGIGNVEVGMISFGETSYADGVAYSMAGGGAAGSLPFPLSLLAAVDPVSRVKAAAAHDAVYGSGADVIVNPHYEVKVQNFVVFKQIDATVRGRKGTITGYSQM